MQASTDKEYVMVYTNCKFVLLGQYESEFCCYLFVFIACRKFFFHACTIDSFKTSILQEAVMYELIDINSIIITIVMTCLFGRFFGYSY